MARPKSEQPKHCRQRGKYGDRGFVKLNGERFYTGPWGTDEAQSEYLRLCAEWIAGGRRPLGSGPAAVAAAVEPPPVVAGTVTSPAPGCSVKAVVAAYWLQAKGRFATCVRTDGSKERYTGELSNIRDALRPLKRIYGETPAADFGPKRLKALRAELAREGLCRSYINRTVRRIVAAFAWAASEEIIPAAVPDALNTVAGLRRGEMGVREADPVRPVSEAEITAVLKYLPKPVRALVELQAILGNRGGELFGLRTCDVNRADPRAWEFRPAAHKNAHRGQGRLIVFGPRAQKILEPFLKADLQAPCFSPGDAEAERHRVQRENRASPVTPSQRLRGQLARRRGDRRLREPGDTYDRHSYRRAIARACETAFGMPKELRRIPKGETPEAKRERQARAREWRAAHVWTPHQLRHTVATLLRKRYGLDAAHVVLGHSTMTATQLYAEQDIAKAKEIMAEVG